MSAQDILARNRVIFTHFDSYSTALVFPRWESKSMLYPAALPESATAMPAPDATGHEHDAGLVM